MAENIEQIMELRARAAEARDMTVKPIDRILWNVRDENIDEIVLLDVCVHIEQMHDRCWWIGIYKKEGDADAPYWTGNFICDSRGRMRFTEQENGGIEWGDDHAHGEVRGKIPQKSDG
jgi:hypothetical protein